MVRTYTPVHTHIRTHIHAYHTYVHTHTYIGVYILTYAHSMHIYTHIITVQHYINLLYCMFTLQNSWRIYEPYRIKSLHLEQKILIRLDRISIHMVDFYRPSNVHITKHQICGSVHKILSSSTNTISK